MKSPAHRRQTSIDSVASIASLTDSGLPSSTANTPQETTPQGPMGFRPLSECDSKAFLSVLERLLPQAKTTQVL